MGAVESTNAVPKKQKKFEFPKLFEALLEMAEE
jgi:hypothetical protein